MSDKKKPGRRGWKYLVFWKPDKRGEPGEVSVVGSSSIPPSARKEGAITKLPWIDNGVTKHHNVQILKKGDDEKTLLDIGVNAFTGEMLQPDDRAFTSTVLALKKHQAGVLKAQKKAACNANADIGLSALSGKGICDGTPIQPPLKRVRGESSDSLVSMSSNVDGSQLLHLSTPIPPNQVEISPSSSSQKIIFSSDALVMSLDLELSSFSSWENVKLVERVCVSLKPHANDNPETRAILQFMESFKNSLHHHAEGKVQGREQKPRSVILPEHFFIKSPEKVELFPGEQFYIHPSLNALIQARCQSTATWKRYADVVLSEIYGENLMWLSCEGLRNTQGIHKALRSGLFAYALAEDPTVTPHDFTWHINNLISNRKNCWRRKMKSTKKGTSSASSSGNSHISLKEISNKKERPNSCPKIYITAEDVENIPIITEGSDSNIEIMTDLQPLTDSIYSGDFCFEGDSIVMTLDSDSSISKDHPEIPQCTVKSDQKTYEQPSKISQSSPTLSTKLLKECASPPIESVSSICTSSPSQPTPQNIICPQLDLNNPYHKAISEMLFKFQSQHSS